MKRQTENPLYLRALLDELRLFGSHEKLQENRALPGRGGSRRPLPAHPRALRGGLPGEPPGGGALPHRLRQKRFAESELLQLLKDPDSGEPMPQAHWAPLHNALDENLLEVDGRLELGHDYLRQAIHERYLRDEETEAKLPPAHRRRARQRPLHDRASGRGAALAAAWSSGVEAADGGAHAADVFLGTTARR
jgi:hypothetical protein